MTGGLEAHKINIWRRGYPHEGTPRGKCQRKGVHSISPLFCGHMQPKLLLKGSDLVQKLMTLRVIKSNKWEQGTS